MVALRQMPMGTRYLQRRRIAANAEDGVWVEGATAGHDADSTALEGRPDGAAGRPSSV